MKYDANLNEVKLYYFGVQFSSFAENRENLYMFMLQILHS